MAVLAEEFLTRVRESRDGQATDLVERAYRLAEKAHDSEKRLTGEPFVQHPLEVANILFELGMDDATIAAGFLHDVVEDCDIRIDQIEREFGREVSTLVNGVTKLIRLDFGTPQQQKAENLRKMFLAMAQDVRVIIIKLADRLHNLRTLDPFSEQRRKEIANETLQIFAPLAHRLGIWRLKWELEDRSFKHAMPEVYEDMVRKVQRTRTERLHQVDEAIAMIREKLNDEGVSAEIQGRPKHLYSIYIKLQKQELDFERIHDLTAVRVIVETLPECYHALGIVHQLWVPIESEYTDYIAKPKPNGYQSLHTKVLGIHNDPMEVQIRTREMHRNAEYGIAAHWKYKEGRPRDGDFDDKLRWLRQILELQTDHQDASEFVDALKLDLFKDQVFVFTPKGDVIELPADSTPIDFAYRIHSEVGHKCVGAKVNGRIVPLEYKLLNGDICEILTSRQSKGPNLDWLELVQTAGARNRIRSFLRKQGFEDNVREGHMRLERAARAAHLELKAILRRGILEKIAPQHNARSSDELLAAIGYGDISAERILEKIRAELDLEGVAAPAQHPNTKESMQGPRSRVPLKRKRDAKQNGQVRMSMAVSAKGVGDVLFTVARCCAPLPGDHISGYITRGRGVTIHRSDCRNLSAYQQREPDRITDVEWQLNGDATFSAEIAVEAIDRVGLLNEITGLISGRKLNIESAHVETGRDGRARMSVVIAVSHIQDLERVMDDVRRLPEVVDVRRLIGLK